MRAFLASVAICATLALVGCSTTDEPVAANGPSSSTKDAAITGASTQKIPVNLRIRNRCTGDIVQLTGELTIVMQRNDNGNGTLIHTKFDVHATGVGTPSGIEYVLNETRSDIYKLNDDGTRSPRTNIVHTRLISKGHTPNYDLFIHYHVVLDDDGQPKVVIDVRDIDCR